MIEQIIPRRKFRIHSKEFGNQWQVVSYQKKAVDVELEGGETVQHRIDNLIAVITELSNTIQTFKTNENGDHDAFKHRISLLYEQIRNGLSGVYQTFNEIEAEGGGADDYNRLNREYVTLETETRTKLTQLEEDVDELLSYEPDEEGNAEKIDAYDYLDRLIDELEEYMSLVLTQLAQVIGDGNIDDVLYDNPNIDLSDPNTDRSLAAALRVQHGKIMGLETMMNQMGVGNPPYPWEKYEYSNLDDPSTCPVKVNVVKKNGDTSSYSPLWRIVFFYNPVFKLLKMTGYLGLSGSGVLDEDVYMSVDVETNKLRFFYTLLDNYARFRWLNHEDTEGGIVLKEYLLDYYIEPGDLKRNSYDTTTILHLDRWKGLIFPAYYNFCYLGISMGGDGDTAYNPSGFGVWDSGLPEKPKSAVTLTTMFEGEGVITAPNVNRMSVFNDNGTLRSYELWTYDLFEAKYAGYSNYLEKYGSSGNIILSDGWFLSDVDYSIDNGNSWKNGLYFVGPYRSYELQTDSYSSVEVINYQNNIVSREDLIDGETYIYGFFAVLNNNRVPLSIGDKVLFRKNPSKDKRGEIVLLQGYGYGTYADQHTPTYIHLFFNFSAIYTNIPANLSIGNAEIQFEPNHNMTCYTSDTQIRERFGLELPQGKTHCVMQTRPIGSDSKGSIYPDITNLVSVGMVIAVPEDNWLAGQ